MLFNHTLPSWHKSMSKDSANDSKGPRVLPESPEDIRRVENPADGTLAQKEEESFDASDQLEKPVTAKEQRLTRIGRHTGLRLVEVSENELKRLSGWSKRHSIFLAFALALLPISVTTWLALESYPEPTPIRTYVTFVIVIAVTGLAGLITLFVGWWERRSERQETDKLLADIMSRLED